MNRDNEAMLERFRDYRRSGDRSLRNELVEEHRYGTDMDSLAKTDRMMCGVLALLREARKRARAALVAKPAGEIQPD